MEPLLVFTSWGILVFKLTLELWRPSWFLYTDGLFIKGTFLGLLERKFELLPVGWSYSRGYFCRCDW